MGLVRAGEDDTRSGAASDAASWDAVIAWRAASRNGVQAPLPRLEGMLAELYLPLLAAFQRTGSLVVAHLGQSLDGRIATTSGASRCITGEEYLLHTHRMRALADAVIVGAGTVAADDPLLTVRRCAGTNPLRVVIDVGGRLQRTQQVFSDDVPTLHVVGTGASGSGGAEVLVFPVQDGRISAAAILEELGRRGLRWIFIEGGGITVSRFLTENALDRLQLTVAPVLLGSGRPSLVLPEIADPTRGLRPTMRRIALGDDLLVECVFR
jgi:diaminohydroxyphosphoribosylaminopyrimidine deaminase/5-amino-6-(5-phosphoribosylamino)uracil reductase